MAVAEPFAPPLQLGFVPITDNVKEEGLDIVTLPELVQLLVSVTVTV